MTGVQTCALPIFRWPERLRNSETSILDIPVDITNNQVVLAQGSSPVPSAKGFALPDPNKIGSSTPFDFSGKNLTPYGGLLPVATMLEKLGFQKLVEEILTAYSQKSRA